MSGGRKVKKRKLALLSHFEVVLRRYQDHLAECARCRAFFRRVGEAVVSIHEDIEPVPSLTTLDLLLQPPTAEAVEGHVPEKLLVLAKEGLLPKAEREQVREHLRRCRSCWEKVVLGEK